MRGATRVAVVLAGVLLSSPVVASAAPSAKASTEAARFQQWLSRRWVNDSERQDPNLVYGFALADLNRDGRKEALVWARYADGCGSGGCELEVFVRAGTEWRSFSTTGITRPPIRVLTTYTRGWRDLGVSLAGGGIERPYEGRLRFDGARYQIEWPADWTGRNPPPRAAGRDLISGATIPLFPAKCRRVREATSIFGPLPLASGGEGGC